MFAINNYNSKKRLDSGVNLIYDLSFPVIAGNDDLIDERFESIKTILNSQYSNAVTCVIADYKNSLLPLKFIENQNICVTNLGDCSNIYGLFELNGDDILVDANAICSMIADIRSSFLFGHEMGHKIAKYRANDATYIQLANILGISFYDNQNIIKETFADECGNIVCPIRCEHGILPSPLTPNKIEGVKRLVLSTAYKLNK